MLRNIRSTPIEVSIKIRSIRPVPTRIETFDALAGELPHVGDKSGKSVREWIPSTSFESERHQEFDVSVAAFA